MLRALGDAPDLSNRPFAEAAATVLAYDLLAGQCRDSGGFPARDASQVAAWERDNHVERIRARIAALSQDPAASRKLTELRGGLEAKLAPVRGQSCAAAVATAALPAAQFAKNAPALLDALDQRQPAPASHAAGASPLAASIDSFGFETRMRMGAGGFLYPVPAPVVLFRSGEAVTDVEALGFPGGLTAHKAAQPGKWTQWRRSGGRLQLLSRTKVWENMSYNVSYSQLPAGFVLDGQYRSLSGSGTVAIGGTDSTAAWREYLFRADGSVLRGSGAGAYSAAGDASTAVSSAAPNRRGRYRIDGLTLNLRYEDGTSESYVIVTDPQDKKAAIWLDGVGFSRRSK
jgi:hypothetical protein